MNIKGIAIRVGAVLAVAAAVGLAGCGNNGSGGGKSALVGRWDLEKGSTHGNPEEMDLLGDGTGIVDKKGITYKTENGRFYIIPQSALLDARSYSYTLSGSKLTFIDDDGDTLKYLKKGHTLSEREVKKFLDGVEETPQKKPVPAKNVKAGSLTDSRNGQTYRTVKIGGKTWMGENLNYKTGQSWCYDDKESNCEKYGRLYDWNTAKSACPKGWHLPSREEWNALMVAVGGVRKSETIEGTTITLTYDEFAGKKLKSTTGRKDNDGTSGNGTDEYGFSALPGGRRYPDGSFFHAGNHGDWWSATESGGGEAYYRNMYYRYDDVYEYADDVRYGFSARCVED